MTDAGAAGQPPTRPRRALRWFAAAGLLVSLGLVVVVAPRASSRPDGLEKVAADHRLDTGEREHDLADGPLAGYGVAGVDDTSVATGVAGLAGVVVTFGLALAVGAGLRRRRAAVEAPTPPRPTTA